MIDEGFRVSGVQPPSFEGDPPSYVFESDLPAAEGMTKLVACREKFAPYQEKTEAELRIVYDRWVDERDCLVGLGYQPAEPPSFEKFVSDWKAGPWMPIDGVDTRSWTDAQYRDAKERCTLEMYDRS
jgi:hypothetical protein